jgi:hypothetical protein
MKREKIAPLRGGQNMRSGFTAALALEIAIGCCRYHYLLPRKGVGRCATLNHRFL